MMGIFFLLKESFKAFKLFGLKKSKYIFNIQVGSFIEFNS